MGDLKLNLGSGTNKIPGGVINVDKFGDPDILFDLETFPWPWEDSSVGVIIAGHSLEHMGGDPNVFVNIMKEIYRVCRDGAQLLVMVPHFRHDDFANDPTHVRIITPEVMELFSKKKCQEWKDGGYANSPLATYHDVDFEIVETHMVIADRLIAAYEAGEISPEEIMERTLSENNVIKEIQMTLVIHKAEIDV